MKKIDVIISDVVSKYKPLKIVYCIENYVMPDYTGPQQLKTVSALIMLQGFVRQNLIKIALNNNIPFKLMTPTPSKLKLFFFFFGRAEKVDMLLSFLNNWDGIKIIPDACIENIGKLDDVIDSFALMCYGYSKELKFNESQYYDGKIN